METIRAAPEAAAAAAVAAAAANSRDSVQFRVLRSYIRYPIYLRAST